MAATESVLRLLESPMSPSRNIFVAAGPDEEYGLEAPDHSVRAWALG